MSSNIRYVKSVWEIIFPSYFKSKKILWKALNHQFMKYGNWETLNPPSLFRNLMFYFSNGESNWKTTHHMHNSLSQSNHTVPILAQKVNNIFGYRLVLFPLCKSDD